MPRTFGDGLVHSSHIDVLVEGDEALNEIPPTSLTPEIQEIAKLIADNLVEDGATIQTGMIMHKDKLWYYIRENSKILLQKYVHKFENLRQILQNHWANFNQTWHKAFLSEED